MVHAALEDEVTCSCGFNFLTRNADLPLEAAGCDLPLQKKACKCTYTS